jgi:hypothetical protein
VHLTTDVRYVTVYRLYPWGSQTTDRSYEIHSQENAALLAIVPRLAKRMTIEALLTPAQHTDIPTLCPLTSIFEITSKHSHNIRAKWQAKSPRMI